MSGGRGGVGPSEFCSVQNRREGEDSQLFCQGVGGLWVHRSSVQFSSVQNRKVTTEDGPGEGGVRLCSFCQGSVGPSVVLFSSRWYLIRYRLREVCMLCSILEVSPVLAVTQREVVVCDTDRQVHVCYNVCGVCVRVHACVCVYMCVCLCLCDCDFYNVTS